MCLLGIIKPNEYYYKYIPDSKILNKFHSKPRAWKVRETTVKRQWKTRENQLKIWIWKPHMFIQNFEA